MKHQVVSTGWASSPEEEKQRVAEAFERDQLRKLVNDELDRYGLLLKRTIVPKNSSWRTKANEHTLFGQLQGQGWLSRPVLHQGTFKECCVVAAKLLDELDASQIPDTATGPS